MPNVEPPLMPPQSPSSLVAKHQPLVAAKDINSVPEEDQSWRRSGSLRTRQVQLPESQTKNCTFTPCELYCLYAKLSTLYSNTSIIQPWQHHHCRKKSQSLQHRTRLPDQRLPQPLDRRLCHRLRPSPSRR